MKENNSITIIPVSIVIPAKNEERNIAECLDHLSEFDDIILVDSGSNDQTCCIAEKYDNVSIVQFNWDGKYPKKRNWALQNCDFKHEWILFLDADEFITDSFKQALLKAITKTSCNGFWLIYDGYFLNHRMHFGDKLHKIALMRKGFGAYERTKEQNWSALDMEVHAPLVVEGQVGKINTPIIHRDYNGLKNYIDRHNEYSSWEANQYYSLHRDPDIWKKVFLRRKIKYFLMHRVLFGPLYFIYSYIFKLGFLDGIPGLIFASMKMSYYTQIYGKIKELEMHKKV